MTAVLFICSANRLRSPTAEQIFSLRGDLEVMSAGLDPHCGNPVTAELVEWADVIFVMERTHRNKLSSRFRSSLKTARVICLNIPDDYEFMDPVLIRLLETRVTPHLR
ncbi:putative protein tyrosine phosphatase [Caulobacter ginsengisoli]|uniref:Phosphotyrosine protein phosphatase I domain-containing protein n=1 Tax=Caulobacter ginsengisoli TaxID=400775 RepID=A0ABU0IRL8_9CAUL|nr:low molecular weight protein tyrosine phosphatase family protein [Caulobacter ginsengisoli]MDQ0464661.1 putative protein tyrosine phosphatase [Caulobacter ginsengisoli]